MPSTNDYALLSNRVYFRTPVNRTVVATSGWTEKQWTRDQSLIGFSAGVYQKGSDIVIAYTGTNEKKVADFAFGNIPAATGLYPSDQVWTAMELYLKVARDNPTANITFTGHSLGGGLAAMMGVFFNRPAVVFDAAPFELGARSVVALPFSALRSALGIGATTLDPSKVSNIEAEASISPISGLGVQVVPTTPAAIQYLFLLCASNIYRWRTAA